jgi:hypothetical protein
VTDCTEHCDWQAGDSRSGLPSLTLAVRESDVVLVMASAPLRQSPPHGEDLLPALLNDMVISAGNAATAALRGADRAAPRAAPSATHIFHRGCQFPQNPQVP